MSFEYDPAKSEANKAKHGIDFEDAQALWDDPWRIELAARTTGEARSLTVGRIAGKLWAAVFARRGVNIRLISVRRARRSEVDLYESD